MRDCIRVIELTPSKLTYALVPGISADPAPELRDALRKVTGERWDVQRGQGEGTPSLREQAEAAEREAAERIRRSPLVEAAFAAFPDAELIEDMDRPRGDRNWSKRA
jgi:DNA polymerase-3 subunit gamma/tau